MLGLENSSKTMSSSHRLHSADFLKKPLPWQFSCPTIFFRRFFLPFRPQSFNSRYPTSDQRLGSSSQRTCRSLVYTCASDFYDPLVPLSTCPPFFLFLAASYSQSTTSPKSLFHLLVSYTCPHATISPTAFFLQRGDRNVNFAQQERRRR